jgi:hypothetical protein
MAIMMKPGVAGKKCSSGDVWKPLTDFYRDHTHGDSQGGDTAAARIATRTAGKKQALVRNGLAK